MRRRLSTSRERINIIPVVFFLLFCVGLFLGDGRQAFVDTLFVGGITLLWAIALYCGMKLAPLSKTTYFLWIALFAATLISTLLSDSAGYSLSWDARLCMGFLIYYLFYSLSNQKSLRTFAGGTIVVALLALVAAGAYSYIPFLTKRVPAMSILYSSYGHNPVSVLFLFVIPLIIEDGIVLRAWLRKVLLIIFLVGALLSFARGVWALLVVYLIFQLGTKRLRGPFYKAVTAMFICGVAGLLITMFVLTPLLNHTSWRQDNGLLYKQTIKPSPYDNRIYYWEQTLRVIQERPIFGSGPGTFSLESQRLQTAPNTSSWFAHSFLLETLAGIGFVGTIPLGILLFYLGREIVSRYARGNRNTNVRYDKGLSYGILLIFIYSMYDFSMDYIVVWLFFWATLGVLTQPKNITKP